jgi:signal transduction histidine kinase
MSSRTARPGLQPIRSAAWRISLWATLAFAFGTSLVFIMLHQFMAQDIQRRTDAWLSGEVEVLADVAEHTPKDNLYQAVVSEVAELASKEVPNRDRTAAPENDAVFFLQTASNGALQLWVGEGSGTPAYRAIQQRKLSPDVPTDLHVEGIAIPFRVTAIRVDDGSEIYLGLSERDQLRVMKNLRTRFDLLGMLIVFFGFVIVFYTTRRMLGHVRGITEAASQIGQSDLSTRVPTIQRNDEIGQLALTLNRMLDRIESSVHQLHTITDSLAHDLRSPLTAIRGKLELFLSEGTGQAPAEAIVSAIDELDRLTDFLNTSLDVAEAKADALRLNREDLNLDELLRVMVDLYEPSMSDKGLKVQLRSGGPVHALVDAALIHRMVANLLDNEMKHLPSACTVVLCLSSEEGFAVMAVEDNGPGFSPELQGQLFERRVKGKDSAGHGLGLAFVEAVARAHGGSVTASNRSEGGARLEVRLPLATHPAGLTSGVMAMAAD